MSSVAVEKMTEAQIITETQAKEYDHIILVDQSGSMGEKSTKMEGRNRWQEAQEFTESYARFAETVDDDGLTVITFNSKPTVYDGVKADKVHEIFTNSRPGGSTDLAAALEEAFKKKFTAGKKAIIMVITDGAPDSETAVKTSIINAANKLERDEEIGIQFVQIGDDAHAARFLNDLDDNLKDAKFDIVNALTREEAEGYSIEQLLYLALND